MKKIVIAFVAGALFATAGTAVATSVIERVTASVRVDYSVELDGKKVELKNSPLAYNGSSYLPVKEISELLGKEVGFKNGVIKIDTPEAEITEPIITDDSQTATPVSKMSYEQVGYQITFNELQMQIIEREIEMGNHEGQALVEANAKIAEYKQRLKELEARKAELTK